MSLAFGLALPHWQILSGQAAPPATGFAVLPAAGTPSYSVTTTVLDSAGTSYTVSTTVRDSAGTAYTPI